MTSRLVFSLILWSLVSIVHLQGQRPLVSTIPDDDGSTAKFVSESLKRFADGNAQRWTFETIADCSAAAQKARAGILLTTEKCVRQLQGSDVQYSAGVGLPIVLFRHKSQAQQPLPDAFTVGILGSADVWRPMVEHALRAFLGRDVVVRARAADESTLFHDLAAGTYYAIGVIEDGSGSSVSNLLTTAYEVSTGEMRIAPLDLAAKPAKPEFGARALAISTAAVTPPGIANAENTLPQTALAITLANVIADERRPEATSSFLSLFFPALSAQNDRRPSFAPKAVSVPFLVFASPPPPDVAQAFGRAKFIAPVDGLINPCRLDHEQAYRAFLRSAVVATQLAEERKLALWEHGVLLEQRGQSAREYTLSANALRKSLGETKTDWIEPRMANLAKAATCRAPKRSLFRNNKLAYYEHGLELLRDALYADAVTEDSPLVQEAAACLFRAFNERDGRAPTCGESLNGLWTTYYAPFMPAAVIEAETKRVP